MRLDVFASARPPAIADLGDGAGWRFEHRTLAAGFAHFEVRALASDRPTISIFDYIGDDGAGGGVTSARIAGALRSVGDKSIIVEINSPGGDYFEGVSIYNLLQRHPASVEVQVLGLAASAASVIAMAGDKVSIAQNAELMIHESRGLFYGTADEMEAGRTMLQRVDEAMAGLYAAKSGQAPARLRDLMKAETWFRGQEAVAAGLADNVMERSAQPVAYAESPDRPRDVAALDRLLAKQGMARSDRRDLYRAIKNGFSIEDQQTPPPPRDRSALLRAMTL